MIESERNKWAAEKEITPARLGDDSVRMVSVKAGAFEGFLTGKEEAQMPLGGYVLAQRKVREERQKLLEEAVRAEGEKRRKGRKGGDDEEEEEEGGFIEGSDEDDIDDDDEDEEESENEEEDEDEEEEE